MHIDSCLNTNKQGSDGNNQISEWRTVNDHITNLTGCCHFHDIKMPWLILWAIVNMYISVPLITDIAR